MSNNLFAIRVDPTIPSLAQYQFPATVALVSTTAIDTGDAVTATPVSGYQGPGTWIWSYSSTVPGVFFTVSITFNDGTVIQSSGRSVADDVEPSYVAPETPAGPTDLTESIADVASGPKQVTVDGQTTQMQPLADMIAADRYQKANAASQKSNFPFGAIKFVRPGAVGRSPCPQDEQMNRFFDDPNWR